MKARKVSWAGVPVIIPGVALYNYEAELGFQVYCADWLRKQYELTKEPRYDMWHHSANERDGVTGGFRAKMSGQAKGWPDLVHCGLKLAVELKVHGNKVSKYQTKWLTYFMGIGWTACVVRDFETFKRLVTEA